MTYHLLPLVPIIKRTQPWIDGLRFCHGLDLDGDVLLAGFLLLFAGLLLHDLLQTDLVPDAALVCFASLLRCRSFLPTVFSDSGSYQVFFLFDLHFVLLLLNISLLNVLFVRAIGSPFLSSLRGLKIELFNSQVGFRRSMFLPIKEIDVVPISFPCWFIVPTLV